MLIPLGILASSGAGVPMGDYELISTTLFTNNNVGEIEFTSGGVWASYRHLQLRVVGRIAPAPEVTGSNYRIRFNNQNATYYLHTLRGNGTSVASSAAADNSSLNRIPWTPASSNDFGVFIADILDFNSTTKNKTVRSLGGMIAGSERWVSLDSFAWTNTAAITSIKLDPQNYSFGSGTRISLYGVRG
jgi:hypothetical protein